MQRQKVTRRYTITIVSKTRKETKDQRKRRDLASRVYVDYSGNFFVFPKPTLNENNLETVSDTLTTICARLLEENVGKYLVNIFYVCKNSFHL